jgi:hypothetical protein
MNYHDGQMPRFVRWLEAPVASNESPHAFKYPVASKSHSMEFIQMDTKPEHQKTEKISVDLLLTNGTSVRVNLFVSDMQRVNDLLNDGRAFIPFEDLGGQVRLVNKSTIVTVIPFDEENENRLKDGGAAPAMTSTNPDSM